MRFICLMKKICNKCNIQKLLVEFHKKPNTRDGRSSICRECVSKYKKRHNQKVKTKKNNQIHVSLNLRETEDVSADFYIQLLKVIGGKT